MNNFLLILLLSTSQLALAGKADNCEDAVKQAAITSVKSEKSYNARNPYAIDDETNEIVNKRNEAKWYFYVNDEASSSSYEVLVTLTKEWNRKRCYSCKVTKVEIEPDAG